MGGCAAPGCHAKRDGALGGEQHELPDLTWWSGLITLDFLVPAPWGEDSIRVPFSVICQVTNTWASARECGRVAPAAPVQALAGIIELVQRSMAVCACLF